MKYAFYPGCSLQLTAVAYDLSVKAVARVLDLELLEIEDWNCCGATEYWSQDHLAACALAARNLALVDPAVGQVTAACAACYLNLRKVDDLMGTHPGLAQRVEDALAAGGLSYSAGSVKVRHLLDVICNDVGAAGVRSKVTKPLEGLRVAPYYGCQVVRPYKDFDDPEYPMRMDELLTWLGAEVVDYPVKTHCCGGHLTQISETEAFELIRRLLQSADDYRADVIACMCPMCQLNLDAYQGRVNNFFNLDFKMPIIFFTQLLGVALGIEMEKLGFGKEIVSAEPVIRAKLNARPAEAEA